MTRLTFADRVLLSLFLSLVFAAPAAATNGMYLVGYGAEVAGRAGANLAVADRSLGLQANPAGIAQMQGQHFGIDGQLLVPKLDFVDPYGHAIDAKSSVFAMPSLSYVRGAKASPWTFGAGLISQGGMGATFEGYQTPFGTTDGTYSEVRFLTLTPTVAYAVNEDVAVGVSLNAGYSDVKFRFYPNTSYYDGGTGYGFFGADLTERAKAWNWSTRVGAMWTATPRLQFGAMYQTKTQGDYENGKLGLNQSAIGLGEVTYDAKVEGFAWPAQFGGGVQVRPADRWMITADVRRYLWTDAMKEIDVRGSNPDAASPVTAPVMAFVFNWRDVWATSVGAEYRATPALTLRAGWNDGQNPVPDGTLNPLFPAITEQHVTAGGSWTWGGNSLHLAVERAFESGQTNPNTDPNVNPFGPGSRVDHSQWTLSAGFSRAFSR